MQRKLHLEEFQFAPRLEHLWEFLKGRGFRVPKDIREHKRGRMGILVRDDTGFTFWPLVKGMKEWISIVAPLYITHYSNFHVFSTPPFLANQRSTLRKFPRECWLSLWPAS